MGFWAGLKAHDSGQPAGPEMKPAARPLTGLDLSGFGRAKAHRAEPGPKRVLGPGPFGDH